MELKDLVKKVIRYNKNARIDLIEKAYRFSNNLLKDKKRESGRPWTEHYLEVADEAANLKLDDASIITALMHGIINKGADSKQIKKEFGDEIFSMLDSIERMTEIKKKISSKKIENENLRKVLIAASKDLRVLLIKICDKLVNLRDLGYLPENRRRIIANECMNVYAPLAYRLGLGKTKSELEDLAFKHIDEKNYKKVELIVEKIRNEGEKSIHTLKKIVENKIKDNAMDAEVEARIKHLHSIYKKATGKNYNLGSIMDIVGIRIITNSTDDCYKTLKIIHENFRPVQGKFKDYIAMPKPNGYQSLHTSVLDDKGRIFEVQIRTREMHEFAEEGIAAHFIYKNINHDRDFDKRLGWLKNIVENKEKFLDMNVDLFGSEIFAFTPQGKVFELPENSTVIDFAYNIHSDLGNHCTGARINGNFASLKTKLNNGDIVEVIKSNTQIPSREWLKYAATRKAREKIKQFLRDAGKVTTRNYIINADNKKEIEESLIKINNKNKKIKIAMCCKPTPGDNIIGIESTKTRAIIHNTECEDIKNSKKNVIEAEWIEKFSKPIEILVDAKDRPGLLKEILNIIVRTKIAVTKTNAKLVNKEDSEFSFLVDVKEINALNDLIKTIRKINSVKKVYVNA